MENNVKNYFEILPHTADVRMRVVGETLKNLFEQAVLGMAQILSANWRTEFEIKNQKSKIKINLEARNMTALLIDFLSEVLTLSQINKSIYKVSSLKFQDSSLEAELVGTKVDGFDEDIKAATYHEAKIVNPPAGGGKGFETTIVFDI